MRANAVSQPEIVHALIAQQQPARVAERTSHKSNTRNEYMAAHVMYKALVAKASPESRCWNGVVNVAFQPLRRDY